MILARCQVELKLTGPVMTKSTALGGFGIDAVMAQSQGHYYLPGTLVKGRLREAWQELAAAAPNDCNWPLDLWLGKEQGNRNKQGAGFEPRRARIYFADMRDAMPAATRNAGTRYRIRLDDARGSVEKGALMVLEAPYQSGEEVAFSGPVWFIAENAAELKTMTFAVNAGLCWVTSFGAERSVGFGALAQVSVGPPDLQSLAQAIPPSDTSFQIQLGFEQPFAAGARLLGQNLFESDDVIPGAAVRGAVGELLARGLAADFPELAKHLSQVRITHAFPALDNGMRPHRQPHSLVSFEHQIKDVALLIDPPANLAEPPAFATDWKQQDRDAAAEEMPWPKLAKELRVRTAIAGETRKAADEELFALRMIVPENRRWLASVDLSRIAESAARDKVSRQLSGVFTAGLPSIGKTKAFATVKTAAAGPNAFPPRKDGKYLVCLQTPTLLLGPSDAWSWSNPAALKDAYAQVWSLLSCQSLTLYNFFQTTSLAGGDYLHHTFRRGLPYKPYLLTDAGSVFVFTTEDRAAADVCLNSWLAHGLPLPQPCRDFYLPPGTATGDFWQHCPYIPENGYGEIAVNLPVHEQLAWGARTDV
jgi:hypothetical protein